MTLFNSMPKGKKPGNYDIQLISRDSIGTTTVRVDILMHRDESWGELARQLRNIADAIDPDLSGMEPSLGSQEVE